MNSSFYPTRSFIRFTAKNQLTADLAGRAVPVYVDRDGVMDTALEFRPAGNGVGAYCDVFQATGDCLDEILFQRVTQIMFDPNRHPELYRAYATADEAIAIEAKIAQAIIDAYKQTCLEQRQALVNQFNTLLKR
jgi:hypothetical protein